MTSMFERVLDLTRQMHGLKAQIDYLRARVDEKARSQWQADKAAPTYNVRGLGQIRLDKADLEPTAAVNDKAAWSSYVAERHPEEVTASITLSGEQLAAALEALEFAGVQHNGAEVAVRPAFEAKLLATFTVDREPEPDEHGARPYFATDPATGEVVPGVGGTQSSPQLVVKVDAAVKGQAADEALAKLAAELEAEADDQVAAVPADLTEQTEEA